MRRRCPTVSELNAFLSSAQHLSFSKAAKELFVTQSAISRHIAGLEAYLGHPLFIRQSQGLALTQIGANYLKLVRPAMQSLERATTQVISTARNSQLLSLSVAPTFAANWLFPRLESFRASNPHIAINFVRYHTTDSAEAGDDFDASIQYGYGDWPITVQPKVAAVLDTARRAGICVLNTNLMTPRKSVTAILGLSDHPVKGHLAGCGHCVLRTRCEYRKRGKTCASE